LGDAAVDYLLDTHCWIWWKNDYARVPSPVRRRIGRGSRLHLSVASAFEIAVKYRLGKLKLPTTPPEFVQHLVDDGAVEIAITRAHVLSAAMLPSHHADPFDRLLIAQAQIERLVLVTADPRILAYDVPALDARK
jgi:PIN domain nuclease of toxin-antitoxin system